MADDQNTGRVSNFYDSHPINEGQIIDKLTANSVDLDSLTQTILQDYDQDHYGGTQANDALAELAGVDRGKNVLDICCGLGGPARYLAQNYGCRVLGIDMNDGRIEGAKRLTRMVGLDDLVDFQCLNALELPLEDQLFDLVVSQEGFCHIPQKQRLIQQCFRVLKPGGHLAFTDVLTTGKTTDATRKKLEDQMAFFELQSLDEYQEKFSAAGLEPIKFVDLAQDWRTILVDRLAMYRGLKDQTIKRFGQEHFARWDSAYSFFVGLYDRGELAGGRFLARRG